MKYSPDDASSHDYEVTHEDDSSPIEFHISRFDMNAAPNLYGFSPIPAGDTPVTNKLVNDLREELGI